MKVQAKQYSRFSKRSAGLGRFPFLEGLPETSIGAHGLIALRQGIGNDPTAGSPTVTLLRLVLPLNDQV